MPFISRDEDALPLEEEPEDDFEIELEDDDGELEFVVGPDGELISLEDHVEDIAPGEEDWNENLAENIEEDDLTRLAIDLIDQFEADERSREEWYQTYIDGLDLIGLKREQRSLPWKDACGVFHPILAEALIRYVSEAALELFPAQGPASTRVVGAETADVKKRVLRVRQELNYQLTKKMPENRDDLEMTLWRQAMAGSCFRKIYKCPILGRPVIKMVPMDDFIAAYGTVNLATCNRYTHVIHTKTNDVLKLQDKGFYRDITLSDAVVGPSDVKEAEDELQGQSKSYELQEDIDLLEMYVDVDLPGYEHKRDGRTTGIKLPYIVTIDKESQKILSIYRNHDEDEPFKKRRLYFSHYKFLPGFGIYGFGLIHLLGGLTDASTSILRQLVDAGTISNIPAGFKSRSLRIKGDDTPLRPGELRDVDLPPGMLEKSISWVPSKEPSVVLANLLTALADEGRRLGSISDMKIGDAGANAPVGTTLALIERHMRVISAVGARNYNSMDAELEAVSDILANDMPDQYDYPQDGEFSRKEDFASTQIIPVADPTGSTLSLRIIRLNAVEQLAAKNPQYYDMPLLHRQIVETMEVPNADKVVPLADDFVPLDPVSENMNFLQMRPNKAFINQDHEAHIGAHMAMMSDPIIQQLAGQSPNAAAIQASLMAHVQEHVAFAYRAKMQKALGMALPEPGQMMPPELEASMSRLIAEAAQKVLAEDQNIAAQQQAAQEAQDPMLQLRKQELQIQQMEAEGRIMAARMKSATDMEKVQMQREKETLDGQIEIANLELDRLRLMVDAVQAGVNINEQKTARESQGNIEGIRMAIDSMHKEEDRNERRESAARAEKAAAKQKGNPR